MAPAAERGKRPYRGNDHHDGPTKAEQFPSCNARIDICTIVYIARRRAKGEKGEEGENK